jgi:hypothetical protein
MQTTGNEPATAEQIARVLQGVPADRSDLRDLLRRKAASGASADDLVTARDLALVGLARLERERGRTADNLFKASRDAEPSQVVTRCVEGFTVDPSGRVENLHGREARRYQSAHGVFVVHHRRNGAGKCTERHYVWRLMHRAFVGDIPEGTRCEYIDGDSTSTALENLRFVYP